MYILFYFCTFLLFILGSSSKSPIMIAQAQLLLGISYISQHYLKYRTGQFHPMLAYALIMSLTSISHILAFAADNELQKEIYLRYSSESHWVLGMQIFFIGFLSMLIGFHLTKEDSATSNFFPLIYYKLPSDFSFVKYTVILIIIFLLRRSMPSLGYFTGFINLLPMVSVFFMARKGSYEGNRQLINLSLIITLILTIEAVFYAYLRSDMLNPSIVFLLGVAIGKPQMGNFIKLKYVPLYGFIFAYFVFFNIFGASRENISVGIDRLHFLQEKKRLMEIDKEEEVSPLVRLSVVNQLSKIAQIAEEDGFYQGKTLSYFAYVFIPRFLWPEKPEIAQGSWFALRIGQARMLDNGRISNSINMTIPGELYLNFGYLGIIIGCILFGALMGSLWNTTLFSENPDNFLGTLFALYLIMIALNQMGADLQILITIIAIYVIFVVLTKAIGKYNV